MCSTTCHSMIPKRHTIDYFFFLPLLTFFLFGCFFVWRFGSSLKSENHTDLKYYLTSSTLNKMVKSSTHIQNNRYCIKWLFFFSALVGVAIHGATTSRSGFSTFCYKMNGGTRNKKKILFWSMIKYAPSIFHVHDSVTFGWIFVVWKAFECFGCC